MQAKIDAARPAETGTALRSESAPVAVHGAANMSKGLLRLALSHLESAYVALSARGLPMPVPDGSLGGSGSFDVYFDRTIEDVEAAADSPAWLATHDGLLVHGLADSALVEAELSACMASLLAEAALLSLDPAESRVLRKATAWALAHQLTGELGCRGPQRRMQARPDLGLFQEQTVEASGLFLASLSARQDGGSGLFLIDTWQFAQQNSGDRVTLRASPDVWEAIVRGLENAGEDVDSLLSEFAVARYFAGPEERTRHAAAGPLRTLPASAAVPVLAHLTTTGLPRHVYSTQDLLPYGSAYVEIDTATLAAGDELRVWLRGDPTMRFALTAVRLGADGRELGRVSAPPRSQPSGFLPVLALDGMTHVVVVVVAMPKAILDVDSLKSPPSAGFKLIFDLDSNVASQLP